MDSFFNNPLTNVDGSDLLVHVNEDISDFSARDSLVLSILFGLSENPLGLLAARVSSSISSNSGGQRSENRRNLVN